MSKQLVLANGLSDSLIQQNENSQKLILELREQLDNKNKDILRIRDSLRLTRNKYESLRNNYNSLRNFYRGDDWLGVLSNSIRGLKEYISTTDRFLKGKENAELLKRITRINDAFEQYLEHNKYVIEKYYPKE